MSVQPLHKECEMQKKLSLADRLLARLQKLGVAERKAKELTKGLIPTASKMPVKGTLTEKLTARLIKLGLSERKATELAKGLVPTVKTAIKARVQTAKKTLADVDDAEVEQVVEEQIDSAEDIELDKVAPRVNGHRVRLDLPVMQYTGATGIELLQVMHGLSSYRTYLAAAVKSERGIVAVRKLGEDTFNVKFYPNMAFWDKDEEQLQQQFHAQNHLLREWYERMHFTQEGLTALLAQLAEEAKPKSRMKALMHRFRSVTSAPLLKAFKFLYQDVAISA
jgi:hypothetical protein